MKSKQTIQYSTRDRDEAVENMKDVPENEDQRDEPENENQRDEPGY